MAEIKYAYILLAKTQNLCRIIICSVVKILPDHILCLFINDTLIIKE